MGANTQDTNGVGAGGIAALAREIGATLSKLQVGCRAKPFPCAANGQPEPPTDPRAAHIRREMQREGGGVHWEGVFSLALADLHDGAPDERVRAVFLCALAEIDEQIAQHRRRSRPVGDFVRPLGVVVATALKASHRLELAELRAVESPASAEALASVVAEADRCMAREADMRARVEYALTVERGTMRPVIGRRAGALSLVQA